MKVVTAPEPLPAGGRILFVAGGITGCPDWQRDFVCSLGDFLPEGLTGDLVVMNPRRAGFDTNDPAWAKEQIRWEREGLRRADLVSFWFPKEGRCEITLYELGKCLGQGRPVAVGVEPGYARELDVREQVGLERPGAPVAGTLWDLLGGVGRWLRDGR